jgi:CubicO group peptidase (beta-lactamase class C family)
MSGSPPFPPPAQVTLANWQDPPFNRWAFQHVRELIPTARIPRGDRRPRRLPRDEHDVLGIRFGSDGRGLTVGQLLAETCTDGFLVLHRGRIVAEHYDNSLAPDVPHLLMSVSKSVTATVAGALAGRGLLDPAAAVTDVLPELRGSSFDGATVRHLLDMRAGTHFDESYASPESDVPACERVYLWRPGDGQPRPADALGYFAALHNDGEHGGPFRYRSILTDVLGWVLERAGGARLPELISTELWQPMGAEFDAEVTVDGHGNAVADGGICATLRDVGRFGQLILAGGRAGRTRVVPAAWIADTIRGAPDGPAAFAGGDGRRGHPGGAHYRNCWWVRDPAAPFLHASGINGQHVFVHGPAQLVVVKLSTWPVASSRALQSATIDGVLAIADALRQRP